MVLGSAHASLRGRRDPPRIACFNLLWDGGESEIEWKAYWKYPCGIVKLIKNRVDEEKLNFQSGL